MNSSLTNLSPTQVELLIAISPEELREAEERAFRRLVKKAKLPGFRPGKVPRRIFEQNYGTQTITSEAMEDVVPVVYERAVREHELEPVDRPRMELQRDENGQPTSLKAVVDVRPHIALGEYKGLRLKRTLVPVSDEDVDRSLQTLARERATLVPVDRDARLGDVVTIDYEGTVDGVAFEGGSANGQSAELREDRFIPGFASGIAGMKSGERKEIQAAFPADYQHAELAGKTAVFTIELHEVKELELPAIDDELAKNVSEHQTLDELRADIRRRLETVAAARARRDLGNQAVEALLKRHDFPLPAALVEREIENMVSDAAAMAARVGVSFDDYLKNVEKSEEQLRAEYRPQAERRVKAMLLVRAVGKAENITATREEIQDELRSLARQYGQPVDRVRQALGNNVLPLMEGIVRTKTIEFLVDNAQIEEATVPPAS